ncbi:hypothetical protein [Petralouisia muris]|uniref:hypothetical protein n=1 Tax=Petralouisia muris TaxID=3032872 RepID=UPI0014424F7B|nr:hypothetical protein [Petralouisia muris]
MKKYNSERVRKILNEKQEFNRLFEKELGREWLDADRADEGEIENFLKKHQIVMIKPKFGRGGEEFTNIIIKVRRLRGQNSQDACWKSASGSINYCRSLIQM